ncbi:MAG: MBL fold metallo-hydrolase [Alphaproteobacteria bacterium]|nr:MBL fold metallo-hydrolase [Alphaproteobacteria bacterium]
MRPHIEAFFDDATFTVTYLVSDPATRTAAIIDPVLDYDPKAGRTSTKSADAVLDAAKRGNFKIDWILETHAHADHISAGAYLREKTGAKIVIGEHITHTQAIFAPIFNMKGFKADGADFDRLVKDGDKIKLGAMDIEVLFTPGHTPACISFKIDDAVFVGDTLFMPDYGTARADFPGGDAGTLYRSIKRILSLPPATRLFMCHDYKPAGRDHYVWETTVAEQHAKNIHVKDGVSEAEFVAMRQTRDKTLTKPVLLLPAIQVNIRAGRMPAPDDNGIAYLRIPLNKI